MTALHLEVTKFLSLSGSEEIKEWMFPNIPLDILKPFTVDPIYKVTVNLGRLASFTTLQKVANIMMKVVR